MGVVLVRNALLVTLLVVAIVHIVRPVRRGVAIGATVPAPIPVPAARRVTPAPDDPLLPARVP
jgi:hypothetical protein